MKINWFPMMRLYILTTCVEIMMVDTDFTFWQIVIAVVLINLLYPETVLERLPKEPNDNQE